MSEHHGFSADQWDLVTEVPLDIFIALLGVEIAVESLEKEAHALDVWRERSLGKCSEIAWIEDAVDHYHRPSAAQARGAAVLPEPELLRKLTELSQMLERQVPPAEAHTFKRLLLDLAERVAAASGDLFPGGAMVSQHEGDLVWKIRKALGV